MEDFSNQQIETLKQLFHANNTTLLKAIHHGIEDRFAVATDILRQEIRASEVRILTSVAEFFDSQVLPQVDDHEVRLTALETRVV